MARNKETLVLLLDVGQTMHEHLNYVSKGMSALVERKLVHNKFDEVGVVFFGTDETDNELCKTLDGYENIVVARPISVIDGDASTTVSALPRGRGASDMISAIVVGMDMIITRLGSNSKANKRICLITDAETPVKDPEEGTKEEQVEQLADQMYRQGLSMDVVVLHPQGLSNSIRSEASQENEFLLRKFAVCTKGDLVVAQSYTSFLGSIRTRVVSPTTLYRGDLELSPDMSIKVWVYKKVNPERIPTLKIYSDKAPLSDQYASRDVKIDTEYKSTVDPDASIPPEQRIKAYKYGPQFVPISTKEEEALKFQTEKSLKVVVFTDAANIPRHYYLKEANVFVPEPGNGRAALAISCLARALAETQMVAVVRCVWRAGQTSVVLGVLTPCLATEDGVPDCLYFNILPFSEDLREYQFGSFDERPVSQQPTERQQEAADAIVEMMNLAPDSEEERLKPESTPNPLLQRYYSFLNMKFVDPDAELPPLDAALQAIVEPSRVPYVTEPPTQDFSQQFALTYNTEKKGSKFWQDELEDRKRNYEEGPEPMQLEDGAPLSLDSLTNKKVDNVGSVNPVQDFESMLDRRDSGEWIPKAMTGMKKIISDLLSSAYNGNTYEKAMACLVSLRAGCVMHGEPVEFNPFLEEIRKKCQSKRLEDFWQLVVSKKLTLISRDESPDSEITKEEAESFLTGDPGQRKSSGETPEEEIDEMDALMDDII